MQSVGAGVMGWVCWSRASARRIWANRPWCIGQHTAHLRIKMLPSLLCAASQSPAARNSQSELFSAANAQDHDVDVLGAHSTHRTTTTHQQDSLFLWAAESKAPRGRSSSIGHDDRRVSEPVRGV